MKQTFVCGTSHMFRNGREQYMRKAVSRGDRIRARVRSPGGRSLQTITSARVSPDAEIKPRQSPFATFSRPCTAVNQQGLYKQCKLPQERPKLKSLATPPLADYIPCPAHGARCLSNKGAGILA